MPSQTAYIDGQTCCECQQEKINPQNQNQALLTNMSELVDKSQSTSALSMELTACFAQTNIPLHKIRHPAMISFIEKHTKYAAPSEFTLRNKCLPQIYDEVVKKLKTIAENKYIWVSLDETTDCENRYVANFVFGVLDVEKEYGHSYLFSSAVLEKVNNVTIARFFDEAINDLGKGKMVSIEKTIWAHIISNYSLQMLTKAKLFCVLLTLLHIWSVQWMDFARYCTQKWYFLLVLYMASTVLLSSFEINSKWLINW